MKKYFSPVVTGALMVSSSFAVLADDSSPADLSVGMAWDQDLSVVVELDNDYRFTIGNEGGAFDYILRRGEFGSNTPVSWYVGVGGWSEWDHKEFGARVPIGLNWRLGQGWDMYGQIQPELNLYSGPELQIGGAVGIKYTF
jgi:hypothetical protein